MPLFLFAESMKAITVQGLLQIFIDNMIPVLAIAGVGFYLRRRFAINPQMVSTMMFHVFSPALVFYYLYSREINGGEFLRFYVVMLLLLFTIAGIAYLVLKVQGVYGAERASTVLASFSYNAGNFGLPIISFAFGEEALSWAVVGYVAGTTISYTLGVYIASYGNASIKQSFMNVLRTPSIYAIAAAFLLKGLGIDSLHPSIERTTKLLADASIPLMLVLLGLQLGQFGTLTKLRLILTGTTLRLILAPILALGFVSVFGITGDARISFIMQASMPTAVLTIVLATEFNSDRNLALNLIMTTTFVSPITLSILIYLLQNGVI